MAYKNLVITPPKYANQDTAKSSQFYRGFSTQDTTTRSVTLYDTELIKQDLINQLSTVKGERLMNPEFGTIIWNLIYDPLTDSLKQQIQEDIDQILAGYYGIGEYSKNQLDMIVVQDFLKWIQISAMSSISTHAPKGI
jgi:hypothetical protein